MRLAKSYGTMIQRCCNKSISCMQKPQLLHKLSCSHPVPLCSEPGLRNLILWAANIQSLLLGDIANGRSSSSPPPLMSYATREHTDCQNNTGETISPLVLEPIFQVLHLHEQARYHSYLPTQIIPYGVSNLLHFIIFQLISHISQFSYCGTNAESLPNAKGEGGIFNSFQGLCIFFKEKITTSKINTFSTDNVSLQCFLPLVQSQSPTALPLYHT